MFMLRFRETFVVEVKDVDFKEKQLIKYIEDFEFESLQNIYQQ